MNDRLVLVVSLWVKEENISAYEKFERRAEALMNNHGGRIERVVRLERSADEPFEIHIVTFPDEQAFAAYRTDPETIALAPERERVIARTMLLRGHDVSI